MTIKTYTNLPIREYEPIVIADKGKECRIDIDIGTSRLAYGDSIDIMTHDGSVRISGNHVHELMKSILRFSSRDMLKLWIHFALVTNKAAGRKDIDLKTDYFDVTKWQEEEEKEMRDWEEEWNSKYFTKKETVA